MTQPTEPFQVHYVQARVGDTQFPATWSIPFDAEFRPIETPNAPTETFGAYASIGWTVVRGGLKYCPAYRIVAQANIRTPGGADIANRLQEEARAAKLVLIMDRRTGVAYQLEASVSENEAVVSWFAREHGHEETVLCLDRKDNAWYIESLVSDYRVMLTAEGTETADEIEMQQWYYRVDQHPNALMIFGV